MPYRRGAIKRLFRSLMIPLFLIIHISPITHILTLIVSVMSADFLKSKGNYRDLIAFQKTECIYDITFWFVKHWIGTHSRDRTDDQMIQAARSGKQNIAEGSAAAATSRETEIKLFNVAKSSLQELLLDYEDYLRVRNLALWTPAHPRYAGLVDVCRRNNDKEYYAGLLPKCTPEIAANMAITLIHQADFLIGRLIERAKKDFLEHGGIREEMTRERLRFRRGTSDEQ